MVIELLVEIFIRCARVVIRCGRGWSSTQVRRGLYTHYKDSLLKVGWVYPQYREFRPQHKWTPRVSEEMCKTHAVEFLKMAAWKFQENNTCSWNSHLDKIQQIQVWMSSFWSCSGWDWDIIGMYALHGTSCTNKFPRCHWLKQKV